MPRVRRLGAVRFVVAPKRKNQPATFRPIFPSVLVSQEATPAKMSAQLDGELWQYNLAKVVVVDVSDDYALMQEPLPNACYPVLKETLLPVYKLNKSLHGGDLVEGFLYDWHQNPDQDEEAYFVGAVRSDLVHQLLG